MRQLFYILLGISFTINAIADTSVTQSTLADIAIYPQVSIPATAISLNNATISSEVRARVKYIPVLVGDKVKRGDVLVKLNTKDYKLNLRRAKVTLKGIESRLKLAKYQYEQAQALFQDKAITDELLRKRQADLTTLEAEKETQKVSVEIAQQELDKCLVRAPFDSVVTQRIAQEGELARSGTPLIQVIDISHIEVSAKIQPQDILSFKNAGRLEFTTLNKSYQLKLRTLTATIDPIQRNREARLLFTKQIALPGST
jgi:RND family efflux transporter MFP subunit